MPSLPVVDGALVYVVYGVAVTGSMQVHSGGSLIIGDDAFTAAGINMQGGKLAGITFGLDLAEIGNISGHGQLLVIWA